MSEELKEIQKALFESPAADESGAPPPPPFLDDPACLPVLSEFKARVDDLRRLLFFYVNHLTLQMGMSPSQAIHTYRLRRAAELLDVLSRPPMLVISGEEERLLTSALKNFLVTYKDSDLGISFVDE